MPGVVFAALATFAVSALAASWKPETTPTSAKTDVTPVRVRARAAGWMRLVIAFTVFVVFALIGAIVVTIVIAFILASACR